MQFSINWLKTYVDIEEKPEVLADALTMHGLAVDGIQPAGDDYILDLDITINRPDCMSFLGVAREIAAIYGRSLRDPPLTLEEGSEQSDHLTSVRIDAAELCPRYCCRIIKDIEVAPSPAWLQDRLRSIGLAPINNIVDITNFVLFETGQPLHVFDFDKLHKQRIVVRKAEKGEKLATIDGEDRELDADMLLICDADHPVALAGIMGGKETEIFTGTTRVLLECAYFSPVSIRRTSKSLGMHTDASHLFERGADPDCHYRVLDRCASLIREIAGGTILRGVTESYPKKIEKKEVLLRPKRAVKVLGEKVETRSMIEILENLGFRRLATKENKKFLRFEVPSFRVDIHREIDLIEEIARYVGYDKIKSSLPVFTDTYSSTPDFIREEDNIKILLSSAGFQEIITFSFIDREHNRACCQEDSLPVEILNPLADQMSTMRESLIPGILQTIHFNLNRGNKSLAMYELGNVYRYKDINRSETAEHRCLAMAQTGNPDPETWYQNPRPFDLYDLKGAIELIVREMGALGIEISPEKCIYLDPGESAAVKRGDQVLGYLGKLHPALKKSFDLKQDVFLGEINFFQLISGDRLKYYCKELPKYPKIERDISIIVDMHVNYDSVKQAIESLKIRELVSLDIFDIYEGKELGPVKKALAIRLIYQDPELTLSARHVDQLHKTVLASLENEVGARLRS